MSACARTYVTLCIYCSDMETMKRVTTEIKISPTRTSSRNGLLGWFLDTSELESVDVSNHLDLLLRKIRTGHIDMKKLREMGCWYRTYCLWTSVSGNGGPALKPKHMADLASLEMELHFDLWFDPPDD
ncbi:hypothetical protein D0B32_18700 [Paraburkholderia sp. DHOC27]|nr:hypothetical protein D0B32_18700 [Paraburkholderia sp. DHOC27]